MIALSSLGCNLKLLRCVLSLNLNESSRTAPQLLPTLLVKHIVKILSSLFLNFFVFCVPNNPHIKLRKLFILLYWLFFSQNY